MSDQCCTREQVPISPEQWAGGQLRHMGQWSCEDQKVGLGVGQLLSGLISPRGMSPVCRVHSRVCDSDVFRIHPLHTRLGQLKHQPGTGNRMAPGCQSKSWYCPKSRNVSPRDKWQMEKIQGCHFFVFSLPPCPVKSEVSPETLKSHKNA